MYIELLPQLSGSKLNIWKEFLAKSDLEPDTMIDRTIFIWEGDTLIATGSRYGNILKCIAIDQNFQGMGITAILITELKKDAFSEGIRHLFLYTKPQNKMIFEDLFFYEVAQTENILLMENEKDGIGKFLRNMPENDTAVKTGAIVMNANPFTLGHRHLIETAKQQCDKLFVFVVSEDRSFFSADDRLEMVCRGTSHMDNVTVLPTGPYLISSATFPTYFLKNKENTEQIKCQLDIEIFAKYYAPRFGISTRFVGTEPISQSTAQYNEALKAFLPKHGIELVEIERLKKSGAPISASRVRELLNMHDAKKLRELLPDTTYNFLLEKNFI
jgi:[citrate (pro-3S)-lyase] ligase